MTDFGRQPGDMTKAVYDTDDSDVVDNSESTANHASKHQVDGVDALTLTGLPGKTKITDRGDPAAFDINLGNLTTDGTWQTLSLSGIVPADTQFFIARVQILDDAAGSAFEMRKNGNSNDTNVARLITQVANQIIEDSFFVSVDANRAIQYKATNTTWTGINLSVRFFLGNIA